MDKVKTFVDGFAGGFEDAFERLDKKVEKMSREEGNIEIKSIDDQYFIVKRVEFRHGVPMQDECLRRVVIYRPLQ